MSLWEPCHSGQQVSGAQVTVGLCHSGQQVSGGQVTVGGMSLWAAGQWCPCVADESIDTAIFSKKSGFINN